MVMLEVETSQAGKRHADLLGIRFVEVQRASITKITDATFFPCDVLNNSFADMIN
jgi:hypothetical protein